MLLFTSVHFFVWWLSCRRNTAMENGTSDEIKTVDEVEPKPSEPSKPSFIDKLRAKRWTFKIKNNFTQYVTVEPLICFYMVQVFSAAFIVPYRFHKVTVHRYKCIPNTIKSWQHLQACLSLEQDTYFCNVITINQNSINQVRNLRLIKFKKKLCFMWKSKNAFEKTNNKQKICNTLPFRLNAIKVKSNVESQKFRFFVFIYGCFITVSTLRETSAKQILTLSKIVEKCNIKWQRDK